MGVFDYECECGATKCIFAGGQDGGNSTVIIEVPLNDGTTIFVRGTYEMYGSVHKGIYQFYPEQFSDFFESWLERESDDERSKIFLAKRIWTLSYHEYDETGQRIRKFPKCHPDDLVITTSLDESLIKRCIRADAELNIPTDAEKKAKEIADLQSRIRLLQSRLDNLLRN